MEKENNNKKSLYTTPYKPSFVTSSLLNLINKAFQETNTTDKKENTLNYLKNTGLIIGSFLEDLEKNRLEESIKRSYLKNVTRFNMNSSGFSLKNIAKLNICFSFLKILNNNEIKNKKDFVKESIFEGIPTATYLTYQKLASKDLLKKIPKTKEFLFLLAVSVGCNYLNEMIKLNKSDKDNEDSRSDINEEENLLCKFANLLKDTFDNIPYSGEVFDSNGDTQYECSKTEELNNHQRRKTTLNYNYEEELFAYNNYSNDSMIYFSGNCVAECMSSIKKKIDEIKNYSYPECSYNGDDTFVLGAPLHNITPKNSLFLRVNKFVANYEYPDVNYVFDIEGNQQYSSNISILKNLKIKIDRLSSLKNLQNYSASELRSTEFDGNFFIPTSFFDNKKVHRL